MKGRKDIDDSKLFMVYIRHISHELPEIESVMQNRIRGNCKYEKMPHHLKSM